MNKQLKNINVSFLIFADNILAMKSELQQCKEQLESREALICATKLALEHVIESAK